MTKKWKKGNCTLMKISDNKPLSKNIHYHDLYPDAKYLLDKYGEIDQALLIKLRSTMRKKGPQLNNFNEYTGKDYQSIIDDLINEDMLDEL